MLSLLLCILLFWGRQHADESMPAGLGSGDALITDDSSADCRSLVGLQEAERSIWVISFSTVTLGRCANALASGHELSASPEGKASPSEKLPCLSQQGLVLGQCVMVAGCLMSSA